MKKLIVATAISMLLAGSAMAASIAEHDVTPVNFSVNLLPNEAPTCSATLSATEAVVFWKYSSDSTTIHAAASKNVEFDGTRVEVAVEHSGAIVTATMGALPVLQGIQFELVSYDNNGAPTFHDANPVLHLNAGEHVNFEVHGYLLNDDETTLSDVAGADGFQDTYTLPISYACN